MKSPDRKKRRICNSWYHFKWFRILLLIIALDMLVIGVSFALGFNIFIFFAGVVGTLVRVIIGIAYVLVASYIIHHVMAYQKTKEDTYFVCQHCAHTHKEE